MRRSREAHDYIADQVERIARAKELTPFEWLSLLVEMRREEIATEAAYWMQHSDPYWPRAWRSIGRMYGKLREDADVVERMDVARRKADQKEEAA